MMTPPSSPPLSPASPPLSPTSPTSSTSNVDADAASSPSSSAASSTPLRRRLFALGGLFQKVAASPLSPRRSQAPLKHVASSDACWEEAATDNEDHPDVDDDELDVVVEEEEEELLFAPATVDERLVSSLLPVSSPPEWHQLPAHILELIVESALLPENELTTPWKERAVSIFFSSKSIRRLEKETSALAFLVPERRARSSRHRGFPPAPILLCPRRWRERASISTVVSRKRQKEISCVFETTARERGIDFLSFFRRSKKKKLGPFFFPTPPSLPDLSTA